LLPILVLACTVSQGEAPADEEADTATESPVLSEAPATPGTPVTGDGPRLAVVLVVDQMRADYLDRFAHLFDGGFARLLASGAVFTDAHHDHAVTSTAPGHATIATGTFPATHGIVANDFFDRNEDRSVYSGLDEEAPLLGFPDAAGRSPRRLRREGLADWLKGSYSSGKVVSVALKDRSAIMMGGHRPDLAYWYRAAARGLVTSRYYADDHPAWLATLGLPVLIEEFYREGWDRSREIEVYDASREDDFPGEYREGFRTFPYVFSEREGMADEDSGGPGPGFYDFLPYTPLGDDVVFTFAMRAVQEEALGADETPDVLFSWGSSSTSSMSRLGRMDGSWCYPRITGPHPCRRSWRVGEWKMHAGFRRVSGGRRGKRQSPVRRRWQDSKRSLRYAGFLVRSFAEIWTESHWTRSPPRWHESWRQ
jgi:hypothetical protein